MKPVAGVGIRRLLVLWIGIFACALERPESDGAVDVRYARDLRIGERLLAMDLECTDNITRRIGDSTAHPVLVTFATASDCFACGIHAPGLDSIRRSGSLGIDFATVVYASASQQTGVVRSLASLSSNPVCFDTRGDLWRAHDLSRTPVTVLILRGTIAHIHDSGLEMPSQRSSFIEAIREALRRGSP